MPLVSLDHVSLGYGHLPLIDDASIQIERSERICVIGRNGTGKSTSLQVARLEALEQAVLDAYASWDELDSRSC